MTTTDNPKGHDLAAEASQVLDVLSGGGIAIIPLNVAYAVVGRTADAIRRIFEVKVRSYEKPSGMFGCIAASLDLHIMNARAASIRQGLVDDADLPFSIVAPFHANHQLLAGTDPFVVKTSSKAGTLDMLINAGPFHNMLAEFSHERGMPVFGSSANRSLTGSKYSVDDIEPEVRNAADIIIDHGRCRDANDEGLSSTILDFRDFTVIRRGCRYTDICAYLRGRFEVKITD